MVDQSSIDKIKTLHPKIRDEVLCLFNKINSQVLTGNSKMRVVQATRTIEEQNELYSQGRTKPGKIVTNAKGGDSVHNYALALDFCLLIDKDKNGNYESVSWNINIDLDHDKKADWMEIVNAFKLLGYEWGGDWTKFKDYPHLQKTFNKTIPQLKKLPKKNGFVVIE